MTLEAGSKAPSFDLPTDGSGRVSLRALKGKTIVLYFYPKDDTTGCTAEAQAFQAQLQQFEKLDAVVIGVSRDSIARHEKFKAKYDLTFPLAADEDGATCERYGTWVEKRLYGRTYMGIERTTFLIDATGRIARVWRKVKVAGHAAEVLAAAKAL
jgi:thioredoxin-dependent peroxiredoxin